MPRRRPRVSAKPFARRKKARLAVLPNRARIMATNGPTRIPQVGVVIFSPRPEAASLGLETRYNSSPNPPAIQPFLAFTFCDAALHFVTSRRGGAGGRRGVFLPEAAPEGICGKPA